MVYRIKAVCLLSLLAVLPVSAGFAPVIAASAQAGSPVFHPNGIQPETTILIEGEAQVTAAPDIAYITAGVIEERPTAREAMAAQATAMRGVFEALRRSRIAERDIQTSGLDLSPRYTSVEVEKDGRRHHEMRLTGYAASNQLTVRVRDLDRLGAILDSMVAAGGNTLSGVNFAIEDDALLQDAARRAALAEAIRRAGLYAEVGGYRVARIVSITESSAVVPVPMARMRMAMDSEMATTPVAGGELTIRARVSVQFELVPAEARQ